MERYIDSETGKILTREQLEQEFNTMKEEEQNSHTFQQYLNDCLSGNGFLEKV